MDGDGVSEKPMNSTPQFWVGTSGYSYPDWRGFYYPNQTKTSQMLPFYAREFEAVEINYTFYRIPTAKSLAVMAGKVPQRFKFTLKVNQALTHAAVGNSGLDAQLCREFTAALAPLQAQDKLGCLLAQFPTAFVNSSTNRNYLSQFREQMGNLPIAIEFRHRSWVQPAVFDWLRQLGLGFCCVDSPGAIAADQSRMQILMPAIAVATSEIGYVRLHGRNTAKWWEHEHAHERYDYSYSRDELNEWLPKLQQLSQQTQQVYVFTNNCYESQSIDAARQLKSLLGIAPVRQPEMPQQLELL
jgi:uncharacterized protein YecE (DUF72 family)